MPTSLEKLTDRQLKDFADSMARVTADLYNEVLAVISGAKTGTTFNAAVILESRPQLVQALRDAGYYDLANDFVNAYPDLVDATKQAFKGRKLPPPKFTAVNAETFSQIAQADLEQFSFIGSKAVDELRFTLYKQAIASVPFSDMVETVRAATIGTAKNGAPLANYAYTHANTAVLSFNGEVIKEAGIALGAEMWEVDGPLDGKTRDECVRALNEPIRTEEEWKSVGYWGGAPGGWNCRHQLWPVLDD